MNEENLREYHISFGNPSGRERNPCPICNKPFKVEDNIICVMKSVFKNHPSFGLIHSRCFLKLLLIKYNFDLDEIKKEIVIEKLR